MCNGKYIASHKIKLRNIALFKFLQNSVLGKFISSICVHIASLMFAGVDVMTCNVKENTFTTLYCSKIHFINLRLHCATYCLVWARTAGAYQRQWCWEITNITSNNSCTYHYCTYCRCVYIAGVYIVLLIVPYCYLLSEPQVCWIASGNQWCWEITNITSNNYCTYCRCLHVPYCYLLSEPQVCWSASGKATSAVGKSPIVKQFTRGKNINKTNSIWFD